MCPKAYKTVKMLGQHRRNQHGITYGGGGAAKKKLKNAGKLKIEDFDINEDIKMEAVKVKI